MGQFDNCIVKNYNMILREMIKELNVEVRKLN